MSLECDHLGCILSQSLVQSVNNLVEKEEEVAWNRMKEDTKDLYITKLLHTAELGAVTLSKAFRHSVDLEIKTADVGKANGRRLLPFQKFTRLKIRKVYKLLPVAQWTCSEISELAGKSNSYIRMVFYCTEKWSVLARG